MPIKGDGPSSADGISRTRGILLWWQRTVFFFLCVAIAFLGVGGIELPGLRLSSWSVSRVVFFFWLIGKLAGYLRSGQPGSGSRGIPLPASLLLLVVFVTASLLPDFQGSGDYRYFLFAVFHCLVVVDLFAEGAKPGLLLSLLGTVPGFLVLRGIVSNPSVLNLDQMVRFGYPLDHPNTAGYVFSMGIPLSLAVLVNLKGWIRWAGGFSLGAQVAGLVLSYSRGAWLGCGVSLFALALMEKKLRKAILALGILLFLGAVFVSPVRGRFVSLAGALGDPDVVWRLHVMAAAISIGMENPLGGGGYGREHLRAAVANKQPEFFSQRYIHHSHNVYTELLSGIGFLGLGAFLWLLGSTLVRLVQCARMEQSQEKKTQCPYLGAALIAFMVSGLGDVPFYHHETRIFFFTLLPLSWLYLDQKEETGSPSMRI